MKPLHIPFRFLVFVFSLCILIVLPLTSTAQAAIVDVTPALSTANRPADQIYPTVHAPRSTTHPAITCSPSPCVLPNVQASEGDQPVNSTPIVANPNNGNDLLTGSIDDNCASNLGFFASSDRGTTWNHTCMNTLDGASAGGDPGVGYDLNNVAYITGINSFGSWGVVVFEKSTDNGLTWSAPTEAANNILGGLIDRDWIRVDTSQKSPHVNALYISATQHDSYIYTRNTEISVSHSSDGGTSWTTIPVDSKQIYPNIDEFSNVYTDPDGTVDVAWMRCIASGPTRNCGDTIATYWFSQSTDGGMTWSTPRVISSGRLAPDTCGAFYGCLRNTSEPLSYTPVLGFVYMKKKVGGSDVLIGCHTSTHMTNMTGNKDGSGTITATRACGFSWKSVTVAPSPNGHDQFFPWLSVSPDSKVVAITWLDRRNDPSNRSYQEFVAFSTDGGKSYGKAIPLTTVLSNPQDDGHAGTFMGDNTGSCWAGNILYASWPDSRTRTGMQDEVGGYQFR